MTYVIRPFTREDYEAQAHIESVCFEMPSSAETIRRDDEKREDKYKVAKFVAELDGKTVGFGGYFQGPWAYHPQKFHVDICVLPEFRRRGIGGALYSRVMEELAQFDPISAATQYKETYTDSIAFAQKRGFSEAMRAWESHLDVAAADVTPYTDTVSKVAAMGYEIKAYPDLAADPEHRQKIHALANRLRRDVPSVEPVVDIPFEEWVKGFDKKEFWPGGYFIALKDGEMVGMHNLWKTDEEHELHNGLTAVDRAHRGTGIALAMKVKGVEAARQAGYRKIRTWNESNNQRMLAINMKMGFVRQPAWVTARLVLREGV